MRYTENTKCYGGSVGRLHLELLLLLYSHNLLILKRKTRIKIEVVITFFKKHGFNLFRFDNRFELFDSL